MTVEDPGLYNSVLVWHMGYLFELTVVSSTTTTFEHSLADRGHLFKRGKTELIGQEAELPIPASGYHWKEHRGRKCPHKLWKRKSPEKDILFKIINLWIFFSVTRTIQYPTSEKCQNCHSLQKLGCYLSSEARRACRTSLYLYQVTGKRSFWNIWLGAQIVKNDHNKNQRHRKYFGFFINLNDPWKNITLECQFKFSIKQLDPPESHMG